jgi:hypothetical protein
MNFFPGYFGLNLSKSRTTRFIDDYAELAKLVSLRKIKNLADYGQAMLITQEKSRVACNMKGNIMVSIYVTSYARKFVHESALRLLAQGANILRINSDSLIFSLSSNIEPDVRISKYLAGCYKHEISNIESIAQLGVNSCSILHRDEAGMLHTTLKISGVQQSQLLTGHLGHKAFVDLVYSSVQEYQKGGKEMPKLKVHNVRTSTTNHVSEKKRTLHSIKLNSALTRRVLPAGSSYPFQTFPYGYLGDAAKQKFTNPFSK